MGHTQSRQKLHTPPVHQVRRFRIDPDRSEVRFTVRHLFGLGRASGTFRIRAGEVGLADPRSDSWATATVSAGSFHTGTANRDVTIVSERYLDADRYPDIDFTSTGLTADDAGRLVLSGQLTVCGVVAPIALIVDELTVDKLGLCATARATIDRYAFGVTAGKGVTGRNLRIRLQLVAEPVA